MEVRPLTRPVAVAMLVALLPLGPVALGAELPGTDCTVLPRSSIWNTRIDRLPVHGRSDVWLRSLDASNTYLHPDFGPPSYGIPVTTVGRNHEKVALRFRYDDESDPRPYPFVARTPIEAGSDRHALMVERGTCRLYELFAAEWNDGEPTAGSGAIWDPDTNRLRPVTWTSADAAGLPIFPGLIRWDEVVAGQIPHALRFTVSCTSDDYVWPARHEAGVDDPECPPMGARFRLQSSFDLNGFGAKARVILRAISGTRCSSPTTAPTGSSRARATATGATGSSMS